jgi:acetylglutamate kinase
VSHPSEIASILTEALPYIRRFAAKVVVVKYGGSAVDSALSSFAEDVALMRSVGMLPVVVHGGGPQIGEMMTRLGKEPEFQGGLRVTDAETLEIARMVLVGKVNREIVSSINVHGALAVGLSGEDANFLRATARSEQLGYVGDVEVVDPSLIEKLLAEGLLPVIATIGSDASGQAYNINADTVAGAVAGALRAEKLVFLTDIEGVRADPGDPSSLLRRVTIGEIGELLRTGAIGSGMIPKVEACRKAIEAGVTRAHILDGRVPHALLLEILTDEGVGTMVHAGELPGAEPGSSGSTRDAGFGDAMEATT